MRVSKAFEYRVGAILAPVRLAASALVAICAGCYDMGGKQSSYRVRARAGASIAGHHERMVSKRGMAGGPVPAPVFSPGSLHDWRGPAARDGAPLARTPGMDTNLVVQSLQEMGRGLVARIPYIVVGLLVFLMFYAAGRLMRGAIQVAGDRTKLDPILAELLGGLTSALMAFLGVLVGAVVIFPTFRPGDLLAGLGITSVAVGFAFKDILQNWLAGVFILWRRPFQIGDEIRTSSYEGTVMDINVRATVLKTYDGERVVVPSSEVYTSAVLVRTAYAQRRVKITVGIGYPDSLERARAVIAQALAATPGVLADPGPWIYVIDLAPSSVNFGVYFWTGPRQANVLAVTDAVMSGLKQALDAAGIDIPYPHQVVLFHDATGTGRGEARAPEQPSPRRPEGGG